jgi:cyclopentanol dehydrogenase
MAGRLENKVALITGAGRGMGAEEARLFASEGAKLALGDVLGAEVEQLAKELEAAGTQAIALDLDVTCEEDWAAAVEAVEERFGRLDILINNAGILDPAGIEDSTRELWDRVIEVNQTGTWLGMKAVIPSLRRAGGGSIVNISSIYGIVGSGTSAAYHASKGAVRVLTKTAAIQYGPEGIRVNSVHPGFIDTPMIQGVIPEEARDEAEAALADQTPLARLGVSRDVAYGVLYLACDEAAFVTGSELVIDGGVTAR